MKKKAGISATALFIIFTLILSGCATPQDDKKDTRVSFVSTEKAPEAAAAESEAAASEAVETDPVSAAEPEPSDPVPAAVSEPEPADTAEAAEHLPAASAEPEPAGNTEAVGDDEPWLLIKPDLRERILANIELPGQIEAVYNAAVPIVVPCTEAAVEWSVLLYYWPEGAATAGGIRLVNNGGRFAGVIRTELLPGEKLFWLFRVDVPGTPGGMMDFPGGPVIVENDGPASYSRGAIARNFFYQPLFDVEKFGDSPGARRGEHGWDFREFYLAGDIKRWTCRVLYRLKGGSNDWLSFSPGGIHGSATGEAGEQISYNLPLKNLKPGDEIEYCFEITVLDTRQTFILEQEDPPSFRVR